MYRYTPFCDNETSTIRIKTTQMINKTMNRLLAICCMIAMWSTPNIAQDVWNLEKCINHAMQNNIDIQQGRLNIEQANITNKTAAHSRYPSLNGNTNLSLNFGRTIDPTNNEFITQSFLSNGISLSSNVTLYNAGRINSTIKQSEIDQESANYTVKQSERDIALFVANSYLNVLFAEENLKNAVAQQSLNTEQYNQVESLINAGVRPANELLDLEAQVARGEQNIITQENAVTIAMLNLKQLLMLEPGYQMILERPSDVEILSDSDLITFDEIYTSALSSQPGIRAAELDVRSAHLGEKIAKASLYPSISFGGSLQTNYSNQGRRLDELLITSNDTPVLINTVPAVITFPGQEAITSKNPYINQIDENLSYGFGLGMSIPIYNNYQVKAGIERAKLNTMSSTLNVERQKNTLKTNVQQALADAKAASKNYQAAKKSRDAQSAAYTNATKQYDLGAINSFDYVNSRALLDNAEISLIIAKYDYLFKAKVVDFYMGRPISLK